MAQQKNAGALDDRPLLEKRFVAGIAATIGLCVLIALSGSAVHVSTFIDFFPLILAALLCNMAIIAFLPWLGANRLSSERAALQDVSLAMDSAVITLTGPDGEIAHWSQGCQQLYGWTAEEAIGRRKYELLNSRCEQAGSNAVPQPPGDADLQLVEQRRDGTYISVLERQRSIDRPNRKPLIVLKMLDISARVRSEAALRASETRLAAAADAHKVGVSHWDIASGHLEWSPGSEQRLGLPVGGISCFEEWVALIYPEDVEGIMATVAQATATQEERIGFKYRFRHPDGAERTVEGSARCYYDEHGALKSVVAANVDITERIEREAELRSREAQLRSVLEAAPSPMIVIDCEGAVVEFNRSAEFLWGYSATDIVGGPASRLAAPEEHARLALALKLVPETDPFALPPAPSAAIGLASNGDRLPLSVTIGRSMTPSGMLVTMFCRDVAEQVAAAQRLSELNAELAHVGRQSAMSELAADLAHELNQPLSATANFLATARMLIERGESGPRVAEVLRMGEEQILRSGAIIRRLRDFLAKQDAEMRPESLERTIKEAVDLVLFGTAQYGIRLTYQLDPAADAVFIDRIQVQQVLSNLLRNAVEALRAQPANSREIIITSHAVDTGLIQVTVADNGPGLPEEIEQQLYARFVTTKEGTAMGIGLSISRRIIEAHGGTLTAGNQTGGGAIFCFTLRAVRELDE